MPTQLTVVREASRGPHPIQIALRYQDGEGNVYTDESAISIEVAPGSILRPQVVVAAVRMPSRVAPGIPFQMGLDLANTGGQDARNVLVSPAEGPLASRAAARASRCSSRRAARPPSP
jgi:hypothetical protein